MKYNKDKNQFPKLGFGILLWVGLLYASLGQASETADKPSETAELKEQKSEVTKPVPGSLQDFDILHINNIFKVVPYMRISDNFDDFFNIFVDNFDVFSSFSLISAFSISS